MNNNKQVFSKKKRYADGDNEEEDEEGLSKQKFKHDQLQQPNA